MFTTLTMIFNRSRTNAEPRADLSDVADIGADSYSVTSWRSRSRWSHDVPSPIETRG
jgi:hypothetical protein